MHKYRENLFINCKNQQDQNFAFGNYKSNSHESLNINHVMVFLWYQFLKIGRLTTTGFVEGPMN